MKFYEVTLYNRYGEVYWSQQVNADSPEEACRYAENHEQFGDGDEILQAYEITDQQSVACSEQKVVRFRQEETD
ncbi:MAG: hypothetical protein JWN30_328 [Bacilli bacterium]|nr:hypothetical protein [Bacilli bacterium]